MQDTSIDFIDTSQTVVDEIAAMIGQNILPEDIFRHIRKETIEIEHNFKLTAKQTQQLRTIFEGIYNLATQLGTEDSV